MRPQIKEKPTLADLGLDLPGPTVPNKKTWQEIADEVDSTQAKTEKRFPPDHTPEKPSVWNGVAAVLSFVIPGLGQIFKGQVISGIAFLAATLIGYGLFIVPGIVLHLTGIVDAGIRQK